MEKKAIIAMSGGVDSSVAALLCQQAGYDCMGVTLKLTDNEDLGLSREKPAAASGRYQRRPGSGGPVGHALLCVQFQRGLPPAGDGPVVEAYRAGGDPQPLRGLQPLYQI